MVCCVVEVNVKAPETSTSVCCVLPSGMVTVSLDPGKAVPLTTN